MQTITIDPKRLAHVARQSIQYIDSLPASMRPSWYHAPKNDDQTTGSSVNVELVGERLDELVSILRRARRNSVTSDEHDYLSDVVLAIEGAEDMWDAQIHQGGWLSHSTQDERYKTFSRGLMSHVHDDENDTDGEHAGYALVLFLLPAMSTWN